MQLGGLSRTNLQTDTGAGTLSPTGLGLIVLDENILDGQRRLLASSRVAAKQIGVNTGRKGLKDEEIITFFTRDAGFYVAALRHASYCVVVMRIGQNEVAAFVRRFLRHPGFVTQAQRLGKVIRLSHTGLSVWRGGSQVELHGHGASLGSANPP